MRTEDVTDTLDLALQASGCDQVHVVHKPRLLSDNGSSYVSGDLAEWLKDKGMKHSRGAPYHPQTQGKIPLGTLLRNTDCKHGYLHGCPLCPKSLSGQNSRRGLSERYYRWSKIPEVCRCKILNRTSLNEAPKSCASAVSKTAQVV